MKFFIVAILVLILPGCYSTGSEWVDRWGMDATGHAEHSCEIIADIEYLNTMTDDEAIADSDSFTGQLALLTRKQRFKVCMEQSGYSKKVKGE